MQWIVIFYFDLNNGKLEYFSEQNSVILPGEFKFTTKY